MAYMAVTCPQHIHANLALLALLDLGVINLATSEGSQCVRCMGGDVNETRDVR